MPKLITPGATLVMPARQMQEDRAAWLEARRYREGVGYCIGSSDVPSILGIKDSGTPVQVWHNKVNRIDTPANSAMMWGSLHEETVARYWRDRNRAVTRSVGLIASVREPWNQTSLDKLVLECPLTRGRADPERCALEIKTADAFAQRRWHADIPDRYLAQMCHQLFVSGLEHVHYAVLVGGNDYRQGVMRRDEDAATIEHVMRQVREFYWLHLGTPGGPVEPQWDHARHAAKLLELDAARHPERQETIELDGIGDVLDLAMVRRKLSDLAAQEKTLKARLAQRAAGARYVTTSTDRGSELVLEYRPVNRTRVDVDRLRERYPAVYEDPEVTVQSTSWAMHIAKEFQVGKTTNE